MTIVCVRERKERKRENGDKEILEVYILERLKK